MPPIVNSEPGVFVDGEPEFLDVGSSRPLAARRGVIVMVVALVVVAGGAGYWVGRGQAHRGSSGAGLSSRAASSSPGSPVSGPSAGGAQAWVQRYGGTGERGGWAGSVVMSLDGSRVFVTGSIGTVAYDAKSGKQVWRHADAAFGAGGSLAPPRLAVSPDGERVFVTGTSGVGTDEDFATAAYDSRTGDRLWFTRNDSRGIDIAGAVVVSPDGGVVFVDGVSRYSDLTAQYVTVAYRAATGVELWTALHGQPSGWARRPWASGPQSVAVGRDATTVFVTGGAEALGPTAFSIEAHYVADGRVRWGALFTGVACDGTTSAVAVSPRGDRVVVTASIGGSSSCDVATVAYNAASGQQLWAARYDGPGILDDHSTAIGIDPTGTTVFVAGTSQAPGTRDQDYLTLAYDLATGKQRWVARYVGPSDTDDSATALTVSPSAATVFVTGGSGGILGTPDFGTIAYDTATGKPRWVARYDTPNGVDVPTSITVSPDGTRVVVTGTSQSASGAEYATVAYRN